MLSRTIGDYHFLADKETGMTFRWGRSLDDNPTFAPVPELADISISNHCTKGCDYCYRSSTPNGALMTLEDYCDVLDSMNFPEHGNVFQVALGGGEPLEHPDFFAIIDETLKRGIVPNFTTNGRLLTADTFERLKGKVGAMAISISRIEEMALYDDLLKSRNGIRINLHYILSRNSVEQAIDIVKGKHNEVLKDLNAIVFLTYKPAGRGNDANILQGGDMLNAFLKEMKTPKAACKIGFDACFVPMLLRKTQGLDDYVDFCEGGFFSVYVNERKEVSPCSFSNGTDSFSLNDYDFYDIWLNKLQPYRERQANHCRTKCKAKSICRGACAYYPQITTCYSE